MSRSRMVQNRKYKIPSPVRKIKVFGAEEDTDKYQRCWNCKMIISVDDLISTEQEGNEYARAYQEISSVGSGNPDYIVCIMDLINSTDIALELDMQGNPKSVYNIDRTITPVRGCPFCGNTNLI